MLDHETRRRILSSVFAKLAADGPVPQSPEEAEEGGGEDFGEPAGQPQPQQWEAPPSQEPQPAPPPAMGPGVQEPLIVHCASDCANLTDLGVCGLASISLGQVSPGGMLSCAQYRSTGGGMASPEQDPYASEPQQPQQPQAPAGRSGVNLQPY